MQKVATYSDSHQCFDARAKVLFRMKKGARRYGGTVLRAKNKVKREAIEIPSHGDEMAHKFICNAIHKLVGKESIASVCRVNVFLLVCRLRFLQWKASLFLFLINVDCCFYRRASHF